MLIRDVAFLSDYFGPCFVSETCNGMFADCGCVTHILLVFENREGKFQYHE